MRHSGLLLWKAVALSALAVGCRSESRLFTLPTHLLAGIDREGRRTGAVKDIGQLTPAFQVDLPPLAAPYEMQSPILIAAVGAPACELAVADLQDQAVHVFRTDGTYRYSVFGADRNHPLFPDPTSIGFDRRGRLFVADRSGLVTFVGERGVVGDTFRIPRANGIVASQVVLGADGRVYDNWFASRAPAPSDSWSINTPLVRVWDIRGHPLDSLGRIRRYPGVTLTHALNRGLIDVEGDNVIFARRADARLLVFRPANRTLEPVRVIELPLYYQMQPPIEGPGRGGRMQNALAAHLVAFKATVGGQFLVGQSVSWPTGGSVFRPRTVLAVVDSVGGAYRAFDLGGEIRALTEGGGWIYVLLVAERQLSVQAYDSRMIQPGTRGNLERLRITCRR